LCRLIHDFSQDEFAQEDVEIWKRKVEFKRICAPKSLKLKRCWLEKQNHGFRLQQSAVLIG
jgi:hypothetical protein